MKFYKWDGDISFGFNMFVEGEKDGEITTLYSGSDEGKRDLLYVQAIIYYHWLKEKELTT